MVLAHRGTRSAAFVVSALCAVLAIGVPKTVPVSSSSVRPVGNVGLTDQVNGAVPPDTRVTGVKLAATFGGRMVVACAT